MSTLHSKILPHTISTSVLTQHYTTYLDYSAISHYSNHLTLSRICGYGISRLRYLSAISASSCLTCLAERLC